LGKNRARGHGKKLKREMMSSGLDIKNELRDARGLKIAYLCARYPAISHTFILREVEALRHLGIEIATFSIRRTDADHLLAEADWRAFRSTYAILPPRWAQLLATHLKLLLVAPRAYLSTFALALKLSPAGLRGRLWQCFYFVEAVLLWSECRQHEIRHVHVHLANVAADVALLASDLGSRMEPETPWSWSFTMHGPTEFYDVVNHRLAEKLRSARFVICISDFARSQMMALSPPELWDRLHVVHVGLPIEQFTREEASHEPEGSLVSVLSIGRLVPEKAQAVVLEALALLLERGHAGVTATLAGDGPSKIGLESLARRLGVAERVSFPGAVSQEQIHALYAGARIFCLPSFAEGIPVVLMEAMAMTLPVVSTPIAGIPELIEDGRTGLLVSPGRADLLADAFERLLTNASLCQQLGSDAREKVLRDFNAETTARQLYALFTQELTPSAGQVMR
jgi:colanic acid/amylovoran biosynthesis glycosyltransferase